MNIQVRGVKKVFHGRTVLDIPEISIKSGLIYGIVGPNGAGKSTLLKIIAGLENATDGSVFLDDKYIDKTKLKEITYSNQRPYLYNTTVYKNLSYPLKFRGYDKKSITKLTKEVIEEFGINDIKDSKATTLSGGEAQKVALARALIFNPKCILLDEPTANIDPEYIDFIENVLKRRSTESGCTILIITHNISQARRLCDKILFLNEGQLIEYGDTEKVFTEPKKQSTQRFFQAEKNFR